MHNKQQSLDCQLTGREPEEICGTNELTPTSMKTHILNHNSRIGLLAVALMAIGTTAWSADTPTTLKDAFKR